MAYTAPQSNIMNISCHISLDGLGTAKTRYIGSPVSGKVRRITVLAHTVVDGNNTLTASIQGTSMTHAAAVLSTTNFGTVGQVFVIEPTALNSVQVGQNIGIATDGGGTVGQAECEVLIEQD